LIIDMGTPPPLRHRPGSKLQGRRHPWLACACPCRRSTQAHPSWAQSKSSAPDRLGRTTRRIQSGLFFGHLGALNEIINRVVAEESGGQRPTVLATGGFAGLFEDTACSMPTCLTWCCRDCGWPKDEFHRSLQAHSRAVAPACLE
jgi:type III pantothenate kinase